MVPVAAILRIHAGASLRGFGAPDGLADLLQLPPGLAPLRPATQVTIDDTWSALRYRPS